MAARERRRPSYLMELHSRISRNLCVTTVAKGLSRIRVAIIFGTERRGHRYSVATDSRFQPMLQLKRSRSPYIGWERNGRHSVKRMQRSIDYRHRTHPDYRACSYYTLRSWLSVCEHPTSPTIPSGPTLRHDDGSRIAFVTIL